MDAWHPHTSSLSPEGAPHEGLPLIPLCPLQRQGFGSSGRSPISPQTPPKHPPNSPLTHHSKILLRTSCLRVNAFNSVDTLTVSVMF